MKRFFLTTPLYYVNDRLHLGHAYCTVAADVLARWMRQKGSEVYFLTGTDEHGEKVYRSAEEKGISTLEWCDSMVEEDRKLWELLGITYDDFIRTSEERHINSVREAFLFLKEKDDVYKSFYEGPYCVCCETFFSSKEVEDNGGNCPDCRRPVKEIRKEEAWFFRLSRYRQQLLDFYGKNPSFFAPRFRAAEMINVLKEAPPDLCISRKKERVPWGIDIPGEEDKVFYVWFDALLNYVTAPGLNRENGKMSVSGGVWPADLHLVGKEIYRFHTVIWPALLLALGLPLPARVFGHGWWTVEGEKMSKSRGNVVDPAGIVKEVGLDAFRTFLFRYVSFGQDGDFSRKSLIQHYQSDCANNLGNLFSRTLSMLQKYQEGRVESPGTTEGETIACRTEELVKNMDKDMMELAFTGVLEKIFSLCTDLNSFIEETAPWKMYKEKNERLKGVLYRLIDSLRQITLMLSPFMIEKTPVMKDLLKMETFEWGINKTPHSLLLGKPLILFPRLEE